MPRSHVSASSYARLSRINQLLPAFAGDWAGGRLICIGHSTRNDDMPPGVLTPEEQAILEIRDTNLFDYADEFTEAILHGLPCGIWAFNRKLPWVESRQYLAIVEKTGELLEDSVLCNLSKRMYVRQETIDAHGKAGMEEFLLSRICWSSDSSVTMKYEGGIHRGVWAGDRFEITTMDRLKGGADGWKDVGEEMGKEMAMLWETEYGSDWWKV
ncbi:hypothetical protein FRB93_007294 [Tulasnella sp. JGI-2019a]|nr:hypothetical protein FRB93_007294 [Tulasnella sp. JGI-2019a]